MCCHSCSQPLQASCLIVNNYMVVQWSPYRIPSPYSVYIWVVTKTETFLNSIFFMSRMVKTASKFNENRNPFWMQTGNIAMVNTMPHIFNLLGFFFFSALKFELRASSLLSIKPCLQLFLLIFQIGSLDFCLGPAVDLDPPISMPRFVYWDRLCLLRLALNYELPVSASLIVRITDMHHCSSPYFNIFYSL
jgi:hypothetical protein